MCNTVVRATIKVNEKHPILGSSTSQTLWPIDLKFGVGDYVYRRYDPTRQKLWKSSPHGRPGIGVKYDVQCFLTFLPARYSIASYANRWYSQRRNVHLSVRPSHEESYSVMIFSPSESLNILVSRNICFIKPHKPILHCKNEDSLAILCIPKCINIGPDLLEIFENIPGVRFLPAR